jgi:hypothetical protein
MQSDTVAVEVHDMLDQRAGRVAAPRGLTVGGLIVAGVDVLNLPVADAVTGQQTRYNAFAQSGDMLPATATIEQILEQYPAAKTSAAGDLLVHLIPEFEAAGHE